MAWRGYVGPNRATAKDDRTSNAHNEIRLLSLMQTLRVKSGTGRKDAGIALLASRIARASWTSLRENPTSAAVGFASYICDSKSVRFDSEMTAA